MFQTRSRRRLERGTAEKRQGRVEPRSLGGSQNGNPQFWSLILLWCRLWILKVDPFFRSSSQGFGKEAAQLSWNDGPLASGSAAFHGRLPLQGAPRPYSRAGDLRRKLEDKRGVDCLIEPRARSCSQGKRGAARGTANARGLASHASRNQCRALQQGD